MIHINLLPGSGKKSRSRGGGGGGGIKLGAMFSSLAAGVKDPYLIGSLATVGLSILAVGTLYGWQTSRERSLLAQERQQLQDSTRYAAVLKEKRKAEAQRDSVLRQLDIIRSIDNNRFVWPHLMDEISRALPPYTWLVSLQQTSPMPAPAGALPPETKKKGKADPKKDAKKKAGASTVPVDTLKFRITGHTVDIQALTRFMRLLEASPFIAEVQLGTSAIVIEEGKEVTKFQLDAQYETPDASAIRTVPFAITVR